MIRFVWVLLLMGPTGPVQNQPPVVNIPQPSGPYAIGRVSYDWVDSARPEVLSKVPNTHREIVVDLWYPATTPNPDARTAPYLPDAEKIEKSSYAQFERHWWGTAWPLVVAGSLHTHAYENAAVVPGDTHFSLIIFCHGYSVEPLGYTHQIEELVSHGYVVATIHHTYEVAVTLFPDGRMIPYSVENGRGQDAPTIEAYGKWEKARMDVWAADIRFTLDQISRLNTAAERKTPFAGRIDMHRVGAFGHSFGGLAVARACALDRRITACMNQDGIGLDGPIPHYKEGHMPAQPFMFLRSGSFAPPTNKDGKEQQAQINKEMQDCTAGSYQAWVGIPGFRHMSFADFFLLQAANPEESMKVLGSLRVAEAYTAAFFDKYLSGAHDTLLDREPAKDSDVVIQRYHL